MVRPRLVQEGKPLEDEREIDAWEHQQPLSHVSTASANNSGTQPSSLARAAGSLAPTMTTTTTTCPSPLTSPSSYSSAAMHSYHTVIGGSGPSSSNYNYNSSNVAAAPHGQEHHGNDDMMMMEDDHHHEQQFHQQTQNQQHQQHGHYHHSHGNASSWSSFSSPQQQAAPHAHQAPQQHSHHFTIGQDSHPVNTTYDHTQHTESHYSPAAPPRRPTQSHNAPRHSHHFEIGARPPTERMEGVVQDVSSMGPLVVMDGANLAYAYADALGNDAGPSITTATRRNRLEPNVTGIQVAVQYFRSCHVRVLVVLPASYYRAKPGPRDKNSANALMETDQWDVLSKLKQQGQLVMAPPTDDDDAYVLTIGLREYVRKQQHQTQDPHTTIGAYCLSNDMFRDAQERDPRVRSWLTEAQGRISYTFVNMGQLDDYGQTLLDIVPNPRHELVAWMEQQQQHASHGFSHAYSS